MPEGCLHSETSPLFLSLSHPGLCAQDLSVDLLSLEFVCRRSAVISSSGDVACTRPRSAVTLAWADTLLRHRTGHRDERRTHLPHPHSLPATSGVPNSRPQTGTDLWPGRNRAAQQEGAASRGSFICMCSCCPAPASPLSSPLDQALDARGSAAPWCRKGRGPVLHLTLPHNANAP